MAAPALPTNPQTLATYDISKGDQAKKFVKNVADLLQAIASQIQLLFTASGLASVLNGSNTLKNTALSFVGVDLGTVTTNQSVECLNATGVAVSVTVATNVNITLTLAHLAPGVTATVAFNNIFSGNLTFKLAATNPAGSAYGSVGWKTSTAGINMATGILVAAGVTVIGVGAPATTGLIMVAN